MCGRFSITKPADEISSHYHVQLEFPFASQYNIAPGQRILAVRRNEEDEAVQLLWGLIPAWAKERSIGYKLANARAETVAEKPSFRSAYRSRRCLIPADGFYEWQAVGQQKQPYLLRRADEGLFSLAGLWERWRDPETKEQIESCTILTTDANDLVRSVHHRMPVIIPDADRDRWLDAKQQVDDLLLPFQWQNFIAFPVSTYVNNARNDGPRCQEPTETGDLFS